MSTVITILLTILIFGIIIFIHELGHFLVAKACGIRVNEFSMGMGPTLLKRQKGETQYSLRAFPIGGFVAMEGEEEDSEDERAFNKKPVIKRVAVVLAGAIMNFILGVLLMAIITGAQGQIATTRVSGFQEGSLAQQSGLQIGDEIVKVNGHGIVSNADLRFQLSRIGAEEPINMVVKRDGQKVKLDNVEYEIVEQNGQKSRKLGIDIAVEDLGPGNFISSTIGNSVFYGKLVWASLGALVTGKVSVSELSGPVGVAQAVGQAQSYGLLSVLSLFAFITINVGVFNLLPFPALDGGQFVFLMIEAIRRKPVKQEIKGYITFAGFALLMLLMVFVTVKDIFRLF